jgi:hypothetical protein
MRGLPEEFKKYLHEYMEIILEGYKIIPISSYIYALEIMATLYQDDETRILLQHLFKEIVELTMRNYLTTDEEFDNVNLTEDFFGLLYRLIKTNPFLVFNSELLDDLVYLCINRMDLPHIESSKYCIYFLEKLINFHELSRLKNVDNGLLDLYANRVQTIVRKLGEVLVNKIIAFTLEVPPQMIYEHVKELIKTIVQNYPSDSALWFEKVLKVIPHDSLTPNEREKFIQLILNYSEPPMDQLLDLFYRRCLSRVTRDKLS